MTATLNYVHLLRLFLTDPVSDFTMQEFEENRFVDKILAPVCNEE